VPLSAAQTTLLVVACRRPVLLPASGSKVTASTDTPVSVRSSLSTIMYMILTNIIEVLAFNARRQRTYHLRGSRYRSTHPIDISRCFLKPCNGQREGLPRENVYALTLSRKYRAPVSLEQDTTSLEVELRSISCGPNASMCRVLGRSMPSITCTTLRSFHSLATRTALTWLRPISDLNMYILPPVVCKSARSDASPPLHPGFPRGSRLHLGCSDHDLAVPQNSPSPSMYSTTCNSNSTRISISTLV
jgi:hypothetical protein